MSNEPEIRKETAKEEKLAEISNWLKNNIQVERSSKDSSETELGMPCCISGSSSEVLLNSQNTDTGKNSELSKDFSKKYHLIAHYASDLIAFTTFDENLILTFVNSSYIKVIRFEVQELLGKSLLDFVHQDDKQQIKTALTNFIDAKINGIIHSGFSEKTQPIHFRFRDKSGSWHYLRTTITALDNELLFVSRDITEQKNIQDALITSERRYQNLYNSLIDGSAAVDLQGKIIECNPSFTNMLGYSIDELQTLTFEEITPTKWHDFERKILENQVMRRGYSDLYEKEYIRKDGTIFPVELQTYAIRNDKDQLSGFWAFVRDVSKRKQMEKTSKEIEERFRLAISSITDILYEWDIKTGSMQWFGDIDSRLAYENGAFPRTIKDFLTHIHPQDVNYVQAAAIKGLKSHQKWQGEYRVIKKDGMEVYWYGTGIGIYDQEGNPIKVIGAVTDITERKRAEHALQESRQMLRLIMDTIPVRVFWKDHNSNYLGCNQSFAHDAGRHSPEEIIGKNDFEFGWAEQAELYRADDQFVIQSGQSKCNYEEAQTTPDGRKIWLRTSKIPLLDAEKNIIGVMGTYEDITEQKQAHDALRRSEAQYRLVTENVSDVIWIMDLNLRFTYFSPSNEKLIGYTTEKALNLSLDELLTPESLELALQTFSAEMQLENNEKKDISRYVTLELNEIRTDGTILPVEVRMCFLRDAHQNPVGILGITRDISERKKQELALKKSEAKFVKAFKSSPIAIVINRLSDGKFVEANEAFEKISGYSRDEFLSQSAIELSIWVDFDDRRRFLEEFTKKGSVYNHEYRFRTKAGNVIITRFSAEVIDFNDEPCYLSVLVDVTEQKKMEELLRESEEKYRSIVENTQDIIMLTSPDGRVSYMSPSCVNVLGYTPDDLVGKIPEIFYPEDIEKVQNALSSAMQGIKGSNLEYRILTKDGKTKWVSHSWSPLVTENHELKCIVSVVRDVTESKNAEQILKQKIEELEKYKNVTVNREVKMVDLKNEINELCKQLNQKPKYPSV
jgi:PAS domain S-box-containing protein